MLYYKGHKILGVNFLPRYTLAQYTALSVKPHYWIRTDAPFRYSGVVTTLDDLSDVEISNPTDKQVLTYNATSQKWENKDAMGGMLPQIIASTDTGSTVVATKGGTTIPLTETSTGVFECVLYNGSDTYGEWTLTATLNGDTETTTVDVDTVKIYNVSFAPPIPDGSTVLPTDDIEILLNCANIWDSPITTLSELLADSTTLETVINDNNAIDYLARSTSFAGYGNVTVPTMTDNTHPSGEALCEQTLGSSSYPYYAFDNNSSTAVIGNNSIAHDVAYKFPIPTIINSMNYHINYYVRIKIQYSDNGTTWTDASNEVTLTSSANQTGSVTSTETSAHLYWRFYGTQQSAGSGHIYTIQFYGIQAGITTDSGAMQLIGADNYASNTLLDDSTWRNAICNSEYFESILNVKVPVMTSNTTPEGVCIGDATNGTYNYQAFDGNDTSRTYTTNQIGKTIGYQFISGCKVKKVFFKPYWSGDTYNVEGSNDGNTWNNIGSIIGNVSGSTAVVNATIDYTYYRFNQATKISSNNLQEFLTAQFYGRKDV